MPRFTLGFIIILALGCGANLGVHIKEGGLTASGDTLEHDESGDTGEADEGLTEEEIAAFEGAMIHIVQPASGDFLPYGEDNSFEAIVEAPDGTVLNFEQIEWHSDVDEDWMVEGDRFEDDSIDIGSHNISAVATLPDGSRVAHTVGGVLVQHRNAGTYVGDMIIGFKIDYEGTPVGTSCIGSAIIVVDAYGETAVGHSTCTIDVLGLMTFELDHSFDFELEETTLSGHAFVTIPVLGFELPFSSEGGIWDGEISSTWAGSILGYADLEGRLNVSRLTREITNF